MKNKRCFKITKNCGFTLIELLVVVSIITILTSAVVPSFTSYLARQSIKQAREQVKSDLRTIQNNAMSNSVLPGETSSNNVYWGLYFKNNSPEYYYFASPNVIGISNCPLFQNSNQKFLLPLDTVSNGDYCVIFSSIDGSSIGSAFLTLKSVNQEVYECININTYGLITNGTWNGSVCT